MNMYKDNERVYLEIDEQILPSEILVTLNVTLLLIRRWFSSLSELAKSRF